MASHAIPLRPAPRVRDEARRRAELIEATIATVAEVGFAAATLLEIARRAGVSTGLVAFHFGDKDGLLEAALRHLSRQLSHALARALRDAAGPEQRVAAVIDTVLGEAQFDRRTATAWLAFWGQVPHSTRFARVQRAYQRRLAANLTHALRPLAYEKAPAVAEALAALIDGLWLRATLAAAGSDGRSARGAARDYLTALLKTPA